MEKYEKMNLAQSEHETITWEPVDVEGFKHEMTLVYLQLHGQFDQEYILSQREALPFNEQQVNLSLPAINKVQLEVPNHHITVDKISIPKELSGVTCSSGSTNASSEEEPYSEVKKYTLPDAKKISLPTPVKKVTLSPSVTDPEKKKIYLPTETVSKFDKPTITPTEIPKVSCATVTTKFPSVKITPCKPQKHSIGVLGYKEISPVTNLPAKPFKLSTKLPALNLSLDTSQTEANIHTGSEDNFNTPLPAQAAQQTATRQLPKISLPALPSTFSNSYEFLPPREKKITTPHPETNCTVNKRQPIAPTKPVPSMPTLKDCTITDNTFVISKTHVPLPSPVRNPEMTDFNISVKAKTNLPEFRSFKNQQLLFDDIKFVADPGSTDSILLPSVSSHLAIPEIHVEKNRKINLTNINTTFPVVRTAFSVSDPKLSVSHFQAPEFNPKHESVPTTKLGFSTTFDSSNSDALLQKFIELLQKTHN